MAIRKEWADKAYKMSLQGLNARQITDQLETEYGKLNYDTIRASIKHDRARHGTSRDSQGRLLAHESHKVRTEGELKVYDDIVECESAEDITPKSIMEEKGLDPTEWEVVSFTKNTWQQQTKDGDRINLCQSKLTVRPVKRDGLTLADIDEWFSKRTLGTHNVTFKPLSYDNDEVLEIDIADVHVGLLAWRYESRNDVDIKICKEKFLQGIRDIVDRSKGRSFKRVYFCTLGDILHVDNMQGTTTKGTVQQTDGRITKILDEAFEMINTALDMIRELDTPISYVYTCGNHDTITGYCLVKMLELDNQDIEFDIKPLPQKAIHFGKVLIGLCHGDMPKYNRGQWLISDYRRELGESDFIEEHSGHFHTEETKTYSGILCRSLLSSCNSNSYWENQQGYRSQRGIECFVWNTDKGLRETWYYFY